MEFVPQFFYCTAEEYFTRRSMIDVKELMENYPDFALLLEVNDDAPPKFTKLDYIKVPVRDLEVGSYILVRAGEVCAKFLIFMYLSFLGYVLTCYNAL